MGIRSSGYLLAALAACPAGAITPYAQELHSSVELSIGGGLYQD